MAEKRYRLFNIMQYEKHPNSGELLLTEEKIIEVLEKYKSISEWAYVCHDKDTYTEEDDNNEENIGKAKNKHFHIVLNCGSTSLPISTISKWFGIPSNFINVIRGGQKGFLDCVEYLTHEDERQQMLGKHLYEDSEIKSNFDFRARIDLERLDRNEKAKMGIFKNDKEKYEYKVMYEGMTLRQVVDENRLIYMENFKELEKKRLDYISKRAKMPEMRINYYITGKGGNGKGVISRALARNLFPGLADEDCFFIVGSRGALFEGYDGQPVIIWDDRRAVDLLTELGSRGNVFNVFDTFPTSSKQNVKYSSINLINYVNIVNSVESYTSFLNGLAGEYKDKQGNSYVSEDKNQSYRRFPFIIPLSEDYFELMVNKGYLMDGTYQEYKTIKSVNFNISKFMGEYGASATLTDKVMKVITEPAIEEYRKLYNKRKELRELIEADEDDILEDIRLLVKMSEVKERLTPEELIEIEGFKELDDLELSEFEKNVFES